MQNAEKTIKTECIILSQFDEGIIKIIPNPEWKKTEGIEQAKKNHSATLEMADGKPFSLLCFLGTTSITKEARDFYKSTKPDATKVAFVTQNFFQKMIGTIFTGVSKLPVPTRLFSTEEEALKWLKEPD